MKEKLVQFWSAHGKKALAGSTLLFVVLAAVLGGLYSNANARIQTLEAENNSLKYEYDTAQTALEEANTQSGAIQQELSEAKQSYSALESEMNELQTEYDALVQAQATPEPSASADSKPSAEKSTGGTGGTGGTGSITGDSGKYENEDEDSDYEPDEPTGTVYWTPGGSKYHSTKDCVSLKRSKTINSGSVRQAKAAGKSSPCKNCN